MMAVCESFKLAFSYLLNTLLLPYFENEFEIHPVDVSGTIRGEKDVEK